MTAAVSSNEHKQQCCACKVAAGGQLKPKLQCLLHILQVAFTGVFQQFGHEFQQLWPKPFNRPEIPALPKSF
jgi:hypothetical protein